MRNKIPLLVLLFNIVTIFRQGILSSYYLEFCFYIESLPEILIFAINSLKFFYITNWLLSPICHPSSNRIDMNFL